MARRAKQTQDLVPVSDASLARFMGYHMKRAQHVMISDMNAVIQPMGLRMITFSVLNMVVENPGLRQSQLADALVIERPNLVVILDGLEERDLISRDRVPTDRRAYALNATLAGRQLSDAAICAIEAHEARMLAGVSDEDRNTVLRVLGQVRRTKPGAEQ
ncbi:MarR family transcriptional regulator [Shimia sp.]|uniref:MarR family winged helix-turn-helix transcriptional regulator n=1 Tax=Shimia sp. TaxID=1954381 RepID=UPI003297A5AC